MKRKTIIFLLLILILAAFFRFWRLKTTPPRLHYDENWNKINALETLASGEYKVFYPDNFGREGLFIWLIAFSFKAFGVSPWSLRLVSAIIGVLTILGLFLLAKELFDEKIALLSGFFLAISFWHINFSRIGYRAIMVPFFLCFSFYFLFRGIRKKSALNFILAGVCFGLGFYAYISFRAAVLLLAVAIIAEMLRHWRAICHSEPRAKNPADNRRCCCSTGFFARLRRAQNDTAKTLWQYYLREKLWLWDLFTIVFLIVLLPLTIHFVKTPSDFLSRSSQVSVFSQNHPFKALSVSVAKTLGMFNFYGDPNWRHNLAGEPMLNWAVGILFLIGLLLSLRASRWRAKQSQTNLDKIASSSAKGGLLAMTKKILPRNDNSKRLFLLSWFVIMLLPAILTYEGMPHALRSIGVVPVVCIFAALGLDWLLKQIPNKKIALIILIFFLLYPTLAAYRRYFLKWANNPNVYSSFQ